MNGRAEIAFDDPLMASFAGAQALIRVRAEHIFPTCPRYSPSLKSGEDSVYIPRPGATPVEPAWKGFDAFRDVVPLRKA